MTCRRCKDTLWLVQEDGSWLLCPCAPWHWRNQPKENEVAPRKFEPPCETCDDRCKAYPPSKSKCDAEAQAEQEKRLEDDANAREDAEITLHDSTGKQVGVAGKPIDAPVKKVVPFALSKVEYSSKISFQDKRGNWYSVSYAEERVPNPEAEWSYAQQRQHLIETVNCVVDEQLEEVMASWSK